MGAALLVRRTALERSGWDAGFPFGLEDADLCARLGAVGTLRFAPQAALRHAGGAASAGNPSRVVRGYELGWVRYLAKHDPRRWVAPLLALGTALDLPLRALLLGLRGLGLALRGRGGDARAALRQAGATAWFALVGGPALLRAGFARPPGRSALAIRSASP
jgi:GT2 family glycosyltransferase